MDAFRWVLLSIGGVIFLLIFFLSKRKAAESDRRNEKIAPAFSSTDTQASPAVDELSSLNQLAMNMQLDGSNSSNTVNSPANVTASDQSSSKEGGSKDKLIVLYLVEKHDGLLMGTDIIESLEQAGMRYGDMKIFHYIVNQDSKDSVPVFSIANLIEPGWFDLISISKMKTPGLTLFLNLPGPISGLKAFDDMIKVVSKLESLLPVVLKDKSRNNVSEQMLTSLREEVAEFDRKKAIP